MECEGIYRKSGGANQIQMIREGFEESSDFDISDPDLDINAVTSTLKQYFRRLPTPLITYPVYDLLLAAAPSSQSSSSTSNTPAHVNPPTVYSAAETNRCINLMREAVQELPTAHRRCLEFLVFHLKRVVEREKENLMTSLNVAVVFAPTIMRPVSVQREMSDTARKNEAVQFLIENCHRVFLGE
jgi:hypothetical protein